MLKPRSNIKTPNMGKTKPTDKAIKTQKPTAPAPAVASKSASFVRVKDFVIVRSSPNMLARVKIVNGTEITCIVQNDNAGQDDTAYVLDIHVDDVLANLGPVPETSKSVYGVKVEPFIKTINVQPWGWVYFYRDVDQEKEEELVESLKKVGSFAVKHGLLSDRELIWRYKPARKSKYAGVYINKKGQPGVIEIFSENLDHELKVHYLHLHEFGHYVWFNMLTPAHHLTWTRLFTANQNRLERDSSALTEALRHFKDGEIKAFMEKEEGNDQFVKQIMQYIMRQHKLNARILKMLINNEEFDVIEQVWPDSIDDIVEKEVLLTEYANTSVEEFFAECFAFWALKLNTLPETLRDSMTETLKVSKNAKA